MPEKYTRNPNAKCVICAKAIYKRPADLQRNKGKAFCSMACYGISCRKESPCVVCGNPVLSGLHRITCSRSCSNTHRKGIQYKINRPRDKVVSQRALKVRLIQASGSQCGRCSYNKVEILHVHHKDRNRENNNLDNLELICPNCHFEEHYLEKSWLKGIINNGEVG